MKIYNSRVRKWTMGTFGALLLAFSSGLVRQAQAQPWQDGNMQMQEGNTQDGNLQNWQDLKPEQIQKMLQDLPAEQQQFMQQMWQSITAEQMEKMLRDLPPAEREKQRQMFQQTQTWLQTRLQQQRWNWVRQTLDASGFTDKTLQEAIVGYMENQEQVYRPLRARARDLAFLLLQPATPEEDVKKQLADFQEKMQKEELHTKQELMSLDEKIKYSTQPRLETLLTLLGVLGLETPTLGGVGALFPDSPLGNLRGMG
jgi:hypothetical protein